MEGAWKCIGTGSRCCVYVRSDRPNKIFKKMLHADDITAIVRDIAYSNLLYHASMSIPVEEVRIVDGIGVCLIMKRADCDLYKAVKTRAMSLRSIVQAILTFWSVLARVGIVHGDLKPSNMLVAGDGVYLADFSSSRFLAPRFYNARKDVSTVPLSIRFGNSINEFRTRTHHDPRVRPDAMANQISMDMYSAAVSISEMASPGKTAMELTTTRSTVDTGSSVEEINILTLPPDVKNDGMFGDIMRAAVSNIRDSIIQRVYDKLEGSLRLRERLEQVRHALFSVSHVSAQRTALFDDDDEINMHTVYAKALAADLCIHHRAKTAEEKDCAETVAIALLSLRTPQKDWLATTTPGMLFDMAKTSLSVFACSWLECLCTDPMLGKDLVRSVVALRLCTNTKIPQHARLDHDFVLGARALCDAVVFATFDECVKKADDIVQTLARDCKY